MGLQLNTIRLSALQQKSGCARQNGEDADGPSPGPRAGARLQRQQLGLGSGRGAAAAPGDAAGPDG